MATSSCPTAPSSASVCAVLDRKPGGWPKFLAHWFLRGVLIVPGLAIAGVRDKRLIYAPLVSSTFISLFLVSFTLYKRSRKRNGLALARRRRVVGGRNRLAGSGKLGTRYRVTVRTPKFKTPTSLCVEAPNRREATALVAGGSRGTKIVRVVRGC